MKLASAIAFAALGFSAFAMGVGCASGSTDSANPANVTGSATPSPVENPDNSEYGDDDTTVSGVRPNPKATVPIGFASQATGDDDDSTSTSTDSDAGTHLILNAGASDAGSATDAGKSSSSSSSGSTGTSSSSSSSSGSTGTTTSCKATTSCATDTKATDLGYVSGDTGTDVVNATGTTSHFFKVIVGEDSSSDTNLYMTATLTSPAGSNFDLFVYTDSCSAPTKYSTSTTGTDVAWITIPDTLGSDDQYVVIEVRAVTTTCSASEKWSLKVEGNK